MVPPDPTGGYIAVAAGNDHSCGLHGQGTVVCWGDNVVGQLYEPDGQYTAIAAGSGHTCGLHTDQTISCWGLNSDGQTDVPSGPVHRRLRRLRTLVRVAHEPDHLLLGREHPRAGKPARRPIHRRRTRRRARLRVAHRPDHFLLGQQQLRADRRAPRAVHRHHHGLLGLMRAEHEPDHHLLGRRRYPTRRHVHRHFCRLRRRHLPHLRATHRPDHHLLGLHRRHPTRRQVHRRIRRPRPHLRIANRRDHRLLGRQQVWADRRTHPTPRTRTVGHSRRCAGLVQRRHDPPGVFTAISAGWNQSCAVRAGRCDRLLGRERQRATRSPRPVSLLPSPPAGTIRVRWMPRERLHVGGWGTPGGGRWTCTTAISPPSPPVAYIA